METMTRSQESSVSACALLLAFELGQRVWKLGFSTGLGQRPRVRQIPAGDVDRVLHEMARAKGRLKLPADGPVISCYEAGPDGFWLHRYLVAHGVTNQVVDSSSIEVNRRARRTKTDRLDLGGLLNLLARYQLGDRRVWRVVRVPTVADEDARHLHRTAETLQQDRTRLRNRLRGLLVTAGLSLRVTTKFLAQIQAARLWDGTPIPLGLRHRLTHTWTQLAFVERQLKTLEAACAPDSTTPTGRCASQLQTVRAIGPWGARVLATELFGWRQIQNRRQLGALVGLVPTLYQSGDTSHDQGITRAGNRHVRRMMVQLAWGWVRYQRTSALTRWYHGRFGGGGRRLRRIGIVALARKLLVALWRYLESGVIPEGALLKAA